MSASEPKIDHEPTIVDGGVGSDQVWVSATVDHRDAKVAVDSLRGLLDLAESERRRRGPKYGSGKLGPRSELLARVVLVLENIWQDYGPERMTQEEVAHHLNDVSARALRDALKETPGYFGWAALRREVTDDMEHRFGRRE